MPREVPLSAGPAGKKWAPWRGVSPPRGRGRSAGVARFGPGGTITPTGAGDGTGGSLPWHHTMPPARGRTAYCTSHHHGLKAEARLCSWTGDLA